MELNLRNGSNNAVFFTLCTSSGIFVEICSFGASISRFVLPDRNGVLQNVVLTYADKALYEKNPIYAGAVLAPNAGRIRNSLLPIGDCSYQLTSNDGFHNLHGGFSSATFLNWKLKSHACDSEKAELVLESFLPDGADGFPGNRHFEAIYTLTYDHIFSIRYQAVSDRTTYLNLSNHTYFNLTGDFSRDILTHQLAINAVSYIENDKEHLPQAICPVEATPFDFRTAVSICEMENHYPFNEQLQNANGYNNGFVLSHLSDHPDFILYEEKSGRKLKFYTDAPCLVFYSGGYLSDGPLLENYNETAILPVSSAALALEAQDFPNAPGSSLFPCRFIRAGELICRNIRICF